LRAIDGFAQLIREDFADQLDKEAQKFFSAISANARKMGQLIDDLLQFSRLGRTELQSATVAMRELAETVIEDLKLLEPQRELHLTLGALPNATADAAMVRQVFVNLIANALKFTRTGDRIADIEIGGHSQDGEATYFVRDNGVGFDVKYTHKLFQVFQRLHRTAEFDGTGVGLAIVQRIVQRHGGRVWAEGRLNEGATFYFTLPLAT
jgi:light-regulated signal transduction histidine kinase (bacteriophytochrome)